MIEYHSTPEAMAKALVSYIPNPVKVQREVLAQFCTSPSVAAIKEYRQSWLGRKAFAERHVAFERSVVAEQELHERRMTIASDEFLKRIEAERACVIARRQTNLTDERA